MKSYNRTNFFKHTFCIFNEVNPNEIPKTKPDYTSKSNSTYYFTEEGVYRKSNHWGRAANCRWKLVSTDYKSQNEIVAFANWIDFFPNNENEKLYFIRINSNFIATFHHKYENIFTDKDILRTAKDTSKRMKLISKILETKTWCKYIKHTDFKKLEEMMLNELLFTNKTIHDIKRELNGKT